MKLDPDDLLRWNSILNQSSPNLCDLGIYKPTANGQKPEESISVLRMK